MKHLLSSITLLLLSTVAFGQVPNTFSSGETISSSKINANFSFLANAMAGGNVAAMMHCSGAVGMIDLSNAQIDAFTVYSNPKVAYSNCHSTDNTSFIESSKFCVINYYYYSDGDGGFACQSNSSTYLYWAHNLITAQSLLENKWLFSGVSFRDNYHFVNIFYKVSSD